LRSNEPADGRVPIPGPFETAPVEALVLAAGEGTRFGGNKLLAEYRGRPLLSHVLDVVRSAQRAGLLAGGHVVVGKKDDRVTALCRAAGLSPVHNDRPELGISHSLQLGLAALEQLPDTPVRAALVLLGDQPLVRLAVIEKLIAAWRSGSAPVVRPHYAAQPQVPGHPILLDRSVWPLREELKGDQGFAGLLASHAIPVLTLAVSEYNPDIDTGADLHALEESPP
jgi:molybdenum cofactor cytidylyltransferase